MKRKSALGLLVLVGGVVISSGCAVSSTAPDRVGISRQKVGVGAACMTQDDCDDTLYCHIPPRCGPFGAPCAGVCEVTTPADAGEVCNAFRDCKDEFVCCYPCGIPGCENRCTVPCDDGAPGCFGGCYAIP